MIKNALDRIGNQIVRADTYKHESDITGVIGAK